MFVQLFPTRSPLALFAAVLAAWSLTAAPVLAEGLEGTWELQWDYNGKLIPLTLTFAEENGEWRGRAKSSAGEDDLRELAYKNGKISFIREVSVNKQKLQMAYEGRVENDAMTGKFYTPLGPMEAHGVKVANPGEVVEREPTGEFSLPGYWKMTVAAPGGDREGLLAIEQHEGGKLTATWEAEDGEAHFDRIEVKGNRLTLKAADGSSHGAAPRALDVAVGGRDMAGEIRTAADGGEAALPVRGRKLHYLPLRGPVDLPGHWQLMITSNDGIESKADLRIEQGENGYSAYLDNELGQFELHNLRLEGNDIAFSTAVDVGGMPVPVEAEGSVARDRMNGYATLKIEDATMEFDIRGEKVKPASSGASPAGDLEQRAKSAESPNNPQTLGASGG